MSTISLPARFLPLLRGLLEDFTSDPPRLLVALSGGLDSTVLLHLLRFSVAYPRPKLFVAHFDHRMRPDSGEDAAWVRGLCRAWSLPLELRQAYTHLRGEEQARNARHAFLKEAARRVDAAWIVTAHHADDQAETVLFRILRGTGIAGLRGMPVRSRSHILRPLLPFWRDELEEYALSHGLRWRRDPTNLDDGPARNRIRNVLIPEIEQNVAPGARRSLVRLAALAAESEAGWRGVVKAAHEQLVKRDGPAFLVARRELGGYHPALGIHILRDLLARLGSVPDRIGTRSALQFITDADSGRELVVSGNVRIRIEFDRARLERLRPPEEDVPLRILALPTDVARCEHLALGGRRYRVRVQAVPAAEAPVSPGWSFAMPMEGLHFPLVLRARQAGDRVRTHAGTRSLKRLMIDRRVPRGERDRIPLLVDSAGHVLWVAGLDLPRRPLPDPTAPVLLLTVTEDKDDRAG